MLFYILETIFYLFYGLAFLFFGHRIFRALSKHKRDEINLFRTRRLMLAYIFMGFIFVFLFFSSLFFSFSFISAWFFYAAQVFLVFGLSYFLYTLVSFWKAFYAQYFFVRYVILGLAIVGFGILRFRYPYFHSEVGILSWNIDMYFGVSMIVYACVGFSLGAILFAWQSFRSFDFFVQLRSIMLCFAFVAFALGFFFFYLPIFSLQFFVVHTLFILSTLAIFSSFYYQRVYLFFRTAFSSGRRI